MKLQQVSYFEKMLPNQPEYNFLFNGNDFTKLMYEVMCKTSQIEDPRDEFQLKGTEMFTLEEMASNPVTLRFLQFMIRITNAKRILEIGTFVGLSAMYFAKALPLDGEVVTIEKFGHFAGIARENYKNNSLANKIKLLEGDALKVIPKLSADDPFDIIFIDGNKERYVQYLEMVEPLLSPNGLIIVDDVFFHGDALNASPNTEKGIGAKALLQHVSQYENWWRITLPLSNGILMMTPKSE